MTNRVSQFFQNGRNEDGHLDNEDDGEQIIDFGEGITMGCSRPGPTGRFESYLSANGKEVLVHRCNVLNCGMSNVFAFNAMFGDKNETVSGRVVDTTDGTIVFHAYSEDGKRVMKSSRPVGKTYPNA